MVSGIVLLILAASVPQQNPQTVAQGTVALPDTAIALSKAEQLILTYIAPTGLPGRGAPRGTPWPYVDECVGVSLQDCLRGDWSCQLNLCERIWEVLREPLIRDLERLAPHAGNSAWLFRQRVGYAVRNGEYDRAATIAATCSEREWWCLSLRGFTAHLLGPGSGIPDFEAALRLAPRETACSWKDVSALLGITSAEPQLLYNPRRADTAPPACVHDDEFLRRLWWLSDPLWSAPGNPRYAEHFARHIVAQMHEDVSDLMRAGTRATGWAWRATTETIRKGPGNSRRVGHCVRDVPMPDCVILYVNGGYSFMPDVATLQDLTASTDADWAVEWDRGDERMIPREEWINLEHQTVVLRRGEAGIMHAAARLTNAFRRAQPLQVSLVLGRIHDQNARVIPAEIDQGFAFRATAEFDTAAYLASIEVSGGKLVGRVRHGLRAPVLDRNGFGISSLALVDAGYEAGQSDLTGALLPSLTMRREKVGVYFEVYGARGDEVLSMQITGAVEAARFGERIGTALGLRSSAPVDVKWSEEARPDADGIARKFLVVDLSPLRPGQHRLELTVRTATGFATTSRSIRVN